MTAILTPTPTIPFSDKIATLGRMLAACEILRTRSNLDADDPDAEDKLFGESSMERRIFYPLKELDDPALIYPVCVIVPEKRRYAAFADGGQTTMTHDRGILGLFVADRADRYPNSVEQSARDFENFWGALIDQLAAQSGADWDDEDEPYSRLRISAIEEEGQPQLSPIEEAKINHRWVASAFVFYGRWPQLEIHSSHGM